MLRVGEVPSRPLAYFAYMDTLQQNIGYTWNVNHYEIGHYSDTELRGEMIYKKMKAKCLKTTELSNDFLDNFLIPYTIDRERLDLDFFREISQYKKVISQMPKSWPGFLMGQYASLQLFKENGLAEKYSNHAVMKERSSEELEFLQYQIQHPWKLSFYHVEKTTDQLFFELTDAFTKETYIVYSPGIQEICKSLKTVSMMFLLIAFNGECWQTYGPLSYYTGIQPFDVLYLARLIEPAVQNEKDVPEVIKKNPIPFMMLFIGGNIPLTMHKEHMMSHYKSELKKYDPHPEKLPGTALIEKKQNIYKITLPDSKDFPHFAVCYYHEKKRHLVITAMTDWGYNEMIELLKKSSHEPPLEPLIHATAGMVFVLNKYFSFKVDISSPYDKTFAGPPPTDKEKKLLDSLNAAAKDIMGDINSNAQIDVAGVAEKHNVDVETVKQLIENVKKSRDSNRYNERPNNNE